MPEARAKLVVLDTGPLITLAAAASLDYLLYPGVPVYVPDAVVYEATVKHGSLGAADIAEWAQAHSDQVHVVVTSTFVNFQKDLQAGRRDRLPHIGETAAIETLRYGVEIGPGERGVFITEDGRVVRGAFLPVGPLRERAITITTRDFLEGLEASGRINSADEVYRLAEDAGRFASRSRALAELDAEARAVVTRLLRKD